MSYIAAALALGLYVVWNKYAPRKLKSFKGSGFVPFALLAIGVTTLANTIIVTWPVANVVAPIFGWVGGWFGVSGATVAGVVFVLLAIAALLDILNDFDPEGIAMTAVIVLPVLALVAVGPLAAAGSGLFDSISEAGSQALTNLVSG